MRCVAWGHIHQDYDGVYRGIRMLGSPSTAANTLPGREKFTLDEAGPACRWLVLGREGGVETGLLRA